MQLSIHDAHMNRIGVINNDMPRSLHYSNDLWHEYLAEASSTYEFKVDKTNPAYAMITSNNYISFTTNDVDYVFRILNRKETDSDVTFTCGFMNLELTETVNTFNNTTTHSLLWYLIDPSGPLRLANNAIEIGSNPFADTNNIKYNKVITFPDQQTKLARLLYIMEQWGAEVEFVTDMYNDGSFHSLVINIYDPTTDAGKLGTVRNDIVLRYGTNINGVTREENGETIINAIGMTDENGKYNWNSIEIKDYNAQGQLEFYKDSGAGNLMYAPISVGLFPSTVSNPKLDQWNRHDFSIKAKSGQDMVDYALKMLKQYAYPQVTYTVDSGAIYEMSQSGNNMSRLFHSKTYTSPTDGSNYKTLVQPLKIGDIVMIQDMSFDPANNGLYLQARVTERITSWTDPSQNKYVFSNFKLMKSKIQDGLLGKMQDLINQTAPYTLDIATSDSLIFKNANDSATLVANLKKQGGLVTPDAYAWYQDMTDTSTPIATTQSLTLGINSLPNTDTSVFTVQATIDDTVVAQAQVSVAKVSDGSTGRSVVGQPEYKYMVTTTQVAPTDGWDSGSWTYNMPTMTTTNKYLWQMTHIKYNLEPLDSYTVSLSAVYGDSGTDGNFMSLSPDTIIVPTDGDGSNGIYDNAYTTISVFKGTTDDTDNWSFSISASTGVTGYITNTSYYITGLTADSSFIDITATNKDDNSIKITKRLLVNKTKSGLPGKGVKKIISAYAVSSSATVIPNGDPSIPSGDWKSEIPTVLPGQFTWAATTYVYSDDTKSNPQYSISAPGADGSKIESTVTQYSNSTDLEIPQDWYATIALLNNSRPTLPGMYLWTRTTITYVDSTIEPTVQYINAYYGQDGLPTQLHTAYAYDALGQLDFTTKYPLVNMESHTYQLMNAGNKLLYGTLGTKTATAVYEQVSKPNLARLKNAIRITQTATGQSGWRGPTDGSFSVLPNESYTLSVYLKNNRSTDTSMVLQLGTSVTSDQTDGTSYVTKKFTLPASSDWAKYTVTLTIPANKFFAWSYIYTDNTTTNADWSFTGLKVEHSLTATPWMPNYLEVTADDWPTYMGTYSDTNSTPSQSPYDYQWVTFKGNQGTPGQSPVTMSIDKGLLIIQADAEGVIDPTNGYKGTNSVITLSQGGNNLTPVQMPADGNYVNGTYSISTSTNSISLTSIDLDTTALTVKIGELQQMDTNSASASVYYIATGIDYYGNPFTQNVLQSITKSLNSYGGRVFIMYAPTNDLTKEDMSVNPQYNSLYIGTAVGSNLYSPTNKAQYVWTEYATDQIVYSPTMPLNPLNGERWINNDPNSPNYNQQMVYNSTTGTWTLDMFNANNIFSNRIYSEGGEFRWIKSDNYSESNHIGTMINLETGEIELGSSAVDKDGNPITTSDTSLNRYLSWKDIGNGKKALVIGDVTSGSSLQLTPDRMSFYNGDTEVMYITNQILRINQAILLQGLYIGEHKMESRGSHTVFVFTGGV